MAISDHNIFVGISLQNKGLKPEDFQAIMESALISLGAKKLCFLIADEIDLINRRVFSEGNERKIRAQTEAAAVELEERIRTAAELFDFTRVDLGFARWNDILSNHYWAMIMELKHLFVVDAGFRNDITRVAEGYATRRGRVLEVARKEYLCEYVISELPALLRGVDFEESSYYMMIYPVFPEFSLVEIKNKLRSGYYAFAPTIDRDCQILNFYELSA